MARALTGFSQRSNRSLVAALRRVLNFYDRQIKLQKCLQAFICVIEM
jgi:hypothetical protein